MRKGRQSAWRLFGALGAGALLWGGLLATAACGFGSYNDSNAPQAVTANNGVWDAGQWWPWACQLPDGTLTSPSLPTTPINYTVTGTCGAGGAFALSVDGCEMVGDFDLLGLSEVSTTIPTSYPNAGGWEIKADAGVLCDATATDSEGNLTLDCAEVSDDPDAGPTPVCTSTFKVVTGT